MHPRTLAILAVLLTLASAPTRASAETALRVVVTTKPVHSLTAAIMDGVGAPRLLVDGSASPHTFALKPSAAAAITEADVFIRVSTEVEPFTAKIAAALPGSVTLLTLADVPGLTLLARRFGATFEAHSHAAPHQHDDDDHDDHHHHEHGSHDHAHSGHDEGPIDGHIWLDPANARVMATAIANALAAKDPAHGGLYAANAERLHHDIDALAADIERTTRGLSGRPFLVFHDAYQYFERRFHLTAIGAVTLSPDVQPSAKRLSALRELIRHERAACVFAEPLFQPKLVAAVTEGTNARAGTLDPEGLLLDPGPQLYPNLMRGLASAMARCLNPAG